MINELREAADHLEWAASHAMAGFPPGQKWPTPEKVYDERCSMAFPDGDDECFGNVTAEPDQWDVRMRDNEANLVTMFPPAVAQELATWLRLTNSLYESHPGHHVQHADRAIQLARTINEQARKIPYRRHVLGLDAPA